MDSCWSYCQDSIFFMTFLLAQQYWWTSCSLFSDNLHNLFLNCSVDHIIQYRIWLFCLQSNQFSEMNLFILQYQWYKDSLTFIFVALCGWISVHQILWRLYNSCILLLFFYGSLPRNLWCFNVYEKQDAI